MKQKINKITTVIITLVSLAGCSSHGVTPPSQNSSLNAISPTNQGKKAGYMQTSLDTWVKEDWTPTVAKDPEIQKKYMKQEETVKKGEDNAVQQKVTYTEDDSKSFTLQEYVDKSRAYLKAKPNDYDNSNIHKLESMPVIGK